MSQDFDPAGGGLDGDDDMAAPPAGRRWLNWRTAAAASAALPVLFVGGLDFSNGTPAQASQDTTTVKVGVSQADPVRVSLSRLKINAKMQSLHVDDKTQELQPPAYGKAGWYQAGPEPGENGRAVIAGHLDSAKGPDVFYPLKKARKGDQIVVTTADGTKLDWVVQTVETHKRSKFPTSRVYGGDRKTPELRLITCGGSYEASKGGYQSNVVVFATPA